MVYLIHFDQPLAHAQHYIGFTKHKSVKKREEEHRSGTGAKLMRAVNEAGIGWKIVKVWKDGDRIFERQLKNRKKARCICPICIKN